MKFLQHKKRDRYAECDYVLTVGWDGGDDLDAAELQDALGRLVREIDPRALTSMRGRGRAGSSWLGYHRQRAAQSRARRKAMAAAGFAREPLFREASPRGPYRRRSNE